MVSSSTSILTRYGLRSLPYIFLKNLVIATNYTINQTFLDLTDIQNRDFRYTL